VNIVLRWVTHFLVGFVFYLLLVRVGLFRLEDVALAGLIIGSVFPDVDHPQAFLGKIVKHRGIIHSLLACCISSFVLAILLLIYNVSLLIALAFFIGYLSHLAADSLTVMGVEWLQPFKKGKISFIIRTGSLGESAVATLLILLIITLIIQHYNIQIPRF